jgi:hypothetical protein
MTIMYLFSIFTPYGVNTFLMYPPACAECIRRNPGASTYRDPSRLYVHVNSPSEIDFEMIGNHPLKSNSYTVADFTTVSFLFLICKNIRVLFLGLHCNSRSFVDR